MHYELLRQLIFNITEKTSLRKINGIETVPLGHCLMVCKTMPFRVLFWCPFAKGVFYDQLVASAFWMSVSHGQSNLSSILVYDGLPIDSVPCSYVEYR